MLLIAISIVNGAKHANKIEFSNSFLFNIIFCSDALDGFGITECGSLACLSNPCSNGGICVEDETNETYNDDEEADGNYGFLQKYTTRSYKPYNDKWKCKCPTGYSGANCETSICESNNPCQHGGTCVVFPSSGYLCLCPLGKHGHYCEHSKLLFETKLHFSLLLTYGT
jgi:protein eyes shut